MMKMLDLQVENAHDLMSPSMLKNLFHLSRLLFAVYWVDLII